MGQTLLIILLVAAAGATLFVLAQGLFNLSKNRDDPAQAAALSRRSQDLMRKRVMFQAIAIVVAIILLLAVSR